MDLITAEATGTLCGRSRTSDGTDASVVLAARKHRALVVSSDAGDLLHIDPSLDVEPI